MHRLSGILFAFTILFGSNWSPAAAQDKTLIVFAAASMKNALDDIDAAYTAKTGVKVTVSYAASSAPPLPSSPTFPVKPRRFPRRSIR